MGIEVGDEVTCPRCWRVMMRCLKKPEQGSRDYRTCFEYVEFEDKPGQKTVCPFDGVPWWVLGEGVWVEGKGYTV